MSATSSTPTSHSSYCLQCHLCQKPNAKMKHLLQLQTQPQFQDTYTWLREHQPELDRMACLCLPCIKQIQRNHHKEFTPRWLTKPAVPPKLCNVQPCQGRVYAQTSLMSAAALEECLKAKVDNCCGVMQGALHKDVHSFKQCTMCIMSRKAKKGGNV